MIELTNMVMVQDSATGKVVVINRVKAWPGISFPGGHVENGESIYKSALREIFEETGLTITDLNPCGLIHWCHHNNVDRYMEFLFKTTRFSGELKGETDEGKVFWASFDEIAKMKLSQNFDQYLRLFKGDKYTEAFSRYDDESFGKLEFFG